MVILKKKKDRLPTNRRLLSPSRIGISGVGTGIEKKKLLGDSDRAKPQPPGVREGTVPGIRVKHA